MGHKSESFLNNFFVNLPGGGVKPLFSAILPLFLAGCFSSGVPEDYVGTYLPVNPPSNNTQTKDPEPETLNKLMDLNGITEKVVKQNNSNIENAFLKAHILRTSKNIKLASDALQQNLKDENYITNRLDSLETLISDYNDYQTKLSEYNKSSSTYENLYYDGQYRGRDDVATLSDIDTDINEPMPEEPDIPQINESDIKFADSLYKLVGERFSTYDIDNPEAFISQTLYSWGMEIKTALNDTETEIDSNNYEAQFQTLYNKLDNAITNAQSEYDNAKSSFIETLKLIDETISDIPLTLEDLMKYYVLEQSILNAIKDNVEYTEPPTPTNTQYTAKSTSDINEEEAVKFIYNEDTEEYTLLLTDLGKNEEEPEIPDEKEEPESPDEDEVSTLTEDENEPDLTEDTDINESEQNEGEEEPEQPSVTTPDKEEVDNHTKGRTVKFKASDFTKTGDYFKASKTSTLSYSPDVDTYFEELKKYLYAGGEFDVSARQLYAQRILRKVINNQSLNKDELNLFNSWFDTSLTSDFTNDDIKIDEVRLALSILNKNVADFDIKKAYTVTDTVTLGGKSVNLYYADFGLWTIRGSSEYQGDKDLLKAKKYEEDKDDVYFIDTAFYSGLDEFKAGFKEDKSAPINTKTTFTGNTLAVAQKGDTRKDLTGSASLVIDNRQARGDINLDFNNWYEFAFTDVDFSNIDGFSATDVDVRVKNGLEKGDILIISDEVKGSVEGQLYGPEVENPTEGVGAFNIKSGDNVSVKGAFGVKK